MFTIAGTVIVEHAAGVKVIAGSQLNGAIIDNIGAEYIVKITRLIIHGDPLPPCIMYTLRIGVLFLKIFPVVF